MGYVDPALGQQFLNVPVAQREAEIDPDPMLNDLARKAITGVGDGRHPDPLRLLHQPCMRLNVMVWTPLLDGIDVP